MLDGLSVSRLRCLFGHDWGDHPDFKIVAVRLCKRCRRVESRTIMSGWVRHKHLEVR